uniref:LiPocalin-Related protein n=2 Tax=Caenorhabditis elegans TaxID=6239 RepID=Q23163_CAEEL|eukprot:NP_509851.1 LiPocalin-Related protein [Caenorhabditis elegans]
MTPVHSTHLLQHPHFYSFHPSRMLSIGILSICLVGLAGAQLDAFALPSAQRYAPKPTVPPEFSNYFELDGHARELVDSLLGPRPGGLFPEKTFEIGAPQGPVQNGNQPTHVVSSLEKTLESFFTAPELPAGQALPPGFGSGFSVANNNKALTSFGDIRRSPSGKKENQEVEGSGAVENSIAGIPNVFLKLAKQPTALVDAFNKAVSVPRDSSGNPVFETAPVVPEGGFLPTSEVRRSPSSVSEVSHSIDSKSDELNTEEYGGLSEDSNSSGGGLIGTIFNLIKLGGKKAKENAKNGNGTAPEKNTIGKAVSNLLSGENSPFPKPGSNILTDMLFKTLSSGSLESNGTEIEKSENGSIVLTPAQSAAISSNLEMIQDLIIKPNSPLCTQKPIPVEFELDPLMGQWYQVIYSPPVSTGPCSMVSYKKLSDNGEATGSIVDVYEYTTDGTPYGKPIISSGYALVKGKGELIFRTNSNKEDVTVHILSVGPLNHQGEYEYVVMSTNCNYPVYVFARDTSIFKQKYEPVVNEFLDKSGIVNGISRLLNVVAPVDNTMCIFPPHLFYNQGR